MSMNKTICYVVLYDDISKTTYTVLICQFCTVLFFCCCYVVVFCFPALSFL